MRLPLRAAFRSATRFVAKNPMQMVKMARHAIGMRFAIPLDALRWFAANTPPARNAPQDVAVTADPPAIVFAASVNLMGTPVRASAKLRIDELRVHADELRVQVHLTDVDLKLLGESDSPVATLIKSGALDLSRPGNLVKYMPKRPKVLIEAHDDILILDLMKNPKLAGNLGLRKILQRLTPVVNVAALGTEGDFLIVQFRATPFGFLSRTSPKSISPLTNSLAPRLR